MQKFVSPYYKKADLALKAADFSASVDRVTGVAEFLSKIIEFVS